MAGQRQPIALVQAKGKKHLTKAEIAERERTEVKAPSDRVTPPSYLTATQKKAFRKTVKELRAIDLISNLDVEALARLVIAQEKYREVTETIAKQPLMVTVAYDTGKKDAEGNPIMAEHEVVNSQVERLAIIQDRYFKQCRQGYRVLIVERHLVFYKVNESQQIVTIYAVVDGRREYRNLL